MSLSGFRSARKSFANQLCSKGLAIRWPLNVAYRHEVFTKRESCPKISLALLCGPKQINTEVTITLQSKRSPVPYQRVGLHNVIF